MGLYKALTQLCFPFGHFLFNQIRRKKKKMQCTTNYRLLPVASLVARCYTAADSDDGDACPTSENLTEAAPVSV